METTNDEIRALRDDVHLWGWDKPICTQDDNIHDRAVEIDQRQVEAAVLFDPDAILVLVVTGRHSADNNTATALERIVSGFKQVGEAGAEAGVRVGAETCPRLSFNLMMPLECTSLVCWKPNTANVTYSGYPEHFIHALGSNTVCIHFKDTKEVEGQRKVSWPGDGIVAFGPDTDACCEVEYDSWAIMEYGGPHTPETMEAVVSSTRAIVSWLNATRDHPGRPRVEMWNGLRWANIVQVVSKGDPCIPALRSTHFVL